MLHTKFHQNQPSGSCSDFSCYKTGMGTFPRKVKKINVPEKKIFKLFYNIWAWKPYWSCDQHYVNEFS